MKELLNKIPKRIYIALSGLLLGLTIAFAEIGILAYVALIPMALVILKKFEGEDYKSKSAYLDGFIFYMCFDIVAFHWVAYFYPLDFAGLNNFQSLIVVALGWIGLSLLQSTFSAFVFLILSRIAKTELCRKYKLLIAPLAAALFAINELTQTFTWAGVPWARIAISQTAMPCLMQSASLFGSYFLTFLVVVINFLIAYAILNVEKRRLAAYIALSVFGFNALFGAVALALPTPEQKSIKVASVQGNFESQSNLSSIDEMLARYKRLITEAAENGAELIVLPEGTFPLDIRYMVKDTNGSYRTLDKIFSNLAVELGVTITVGSYYNTEETSHSSMSTFYGDGTKILNSYAKRRPVPFGEFLPMKDLIEAIIPLLAEINIFSNLTPGERSTLFGATSDENAIKVGTLLCFDSIYETLGIDCAREGAEMIIIPSNDSWFYDSRALNMHHSQNILRAVEQRKYVVNSGNTGLTSIVNEKGEVVETMPIYTDGYVISTVYASSGRTIYSYIGNLFVYLCIAFVLIPVAYSIYRKKIMK